MRRILSFHGFLLFCLVYCRGFLSDCICAYTAQDSLQQEIIRDNNCARQAQRIQPHTIKIRERTDPSHRLSMLKSKYFDHYF